MLKIKRLESKMPTNFSSYSTNNPVCDKYIETSLPFFYFIYTKGNDFMVTINGHKIICKKNQGVFINKSVPFSIPSHWVESDTKRSDIAVIRFTSNDVSEHNISYNNDIATLKTMTSTLKNSKDYLLLDFNSLDDLELVTISWMILQYAQQNRRIKKTASIPGEIYNKVMMCFLLSFFIKINSNISCLFYAESSELISEKITKLVIDDYSKNWSIKELSSKLLMSSSSLKQKMYKEVGSVTDFINKLKLTESLRRLRRTNDSISTIANALGYKSPSYFTKVFKKYLNINPADIRLKQRK
ncbi:AraC family transcriptional regulator [Salmonella enterica]|uniref:AraC family transcriptional regulator n=1 Tax=Salmonella enterica TaxID=28901 RepID=UPI0020A39F49|nr:AraC family transcriptional regulator [Salmonella enterica]